MSFRLIASPILLLCLVAAACGGGGGGSSQPENASGLESAARSFGNALFSGEAGDAYEFLSAECKEGITEEEFEAAVAFVGIFLALFEAELGDIEVDDVETRNIGDGRGEAMVTMRGPEELGDSFNEDAEFEEWVYEDGGWRIVECDDFEGFEDGDGGDDDEPAFEGPGSSRNEPAPLGTTVEFSGWQVTVDEVNLDAADSIVSEDSFIEEPEAGDVYVLITLTATYVGDGENESQSFFFAFTAGAVGESAVAYEQFSDGCTFFDLPNQLDASRDLFEGGSISGDICLSVTEDDADSLLLYLETFGFSGSTRAWFDLR